MGIVGGFGMLVMVVFGGYNLPKLLQALLLLFLATQAWADALE
jgi:hypothetical protein